MLGCIESIRKRNGQIVPFQQQKITNAIWAAVQAVGGKDQERAICMHDRLLLPGVKTRYFFVYIHQYLYFLSDAHPEDKCDNICAME